MDSSEPKQTTSLIPNLENDSWLARAMGLVHNKLQAAQITQLSSKITPIPLVEATQTRSGWRPAMGIVKTRYGKYLVKGEEKWWLDAGKDTGKFMGAGITVNQKMWKDIYNAWEGEGKLLYYNSMIEPGAILYYTFQYIRKYRHIHKQANGEEVIVFPIGSKPLWQAADDRK